MPPRHRVIGLGGTFDHFHRGHQHFLTHAAALADELMIGVTADALVRGKPWASTIQSLEERKRQVKQFCHQHHFKATIFPLTEPIGPTLEGSQIRALCVTPETEQGAQDINTLRLKLRLRPLPTYVAPFWKNAAGEVLHSQAIREGRLNAQGDNWWSVLADSVTLTAEQRQFWSEPQGQIVTSPTQKATVIAVVGDICLQHFHQQKWPYHIGIIDGFSQREVFTPHQDQFQELTPVANPAGQITSELIEACKAILPTESAIASLRKQPRHIRVEGEEDLASVVLTLLLPLGSIIYYGQPQVGMVEMVVTPELKDRFSAVLNPNLPRN